MLARRHLEAIPGPQRDAVRIAFGIGAGPAPDRFLIALAVLSLLSEVAAERPLVRVVHTPVQIISGAHDKVVPPANAEFLRQRLSHSKLDIVDAGHFTWEDAAAEYAALVTSWWAGGYQATSRTPASH